MREETQMPAPFSDLDDTPGPPASHERRIGHRIVVSLAVHCQLASGRAFTARATDISLGGIFIESEEHPAFGAEIEIRTLMPGGDFELQLPGFVRWDKAHGFGVQFGLLGARATHELTQLLRG